MSKKRRDKDFLGDIKEAMDLIAFVSAAAGAIRSAAGMCLSL
jgi:hypothetical protein